MNAPKLCYGLESWERLEESVEAVIDRLVDEEANIGESIDGVLNRMEWPVEIIVHKWADVTQYADFIAEQALENALVFLDEEHSDPDGDGTKPTPDMIAASKAFSAAVVKDYRSFMCVPTGDKFLFTREHARALFDEETK